MPRLLLLYLGKRILLTTLLVQVALTFPVVLSALFHNLPPAALRAGLFWPALVGTLPTVTVIALPMAVGVAVALEFSRMVSEGMVAVLYSIKLSVWAIARPALLVAFGTMVLGYITSCLVAPAYVGSMHDVINVARNALNHRMLEPARFYTFEDGRRTIYFERWETPDIARNVFIRQFSDEKKTEETITAEQAEFRQNESNVVMVLTRGQIQSRPVSGDRVRVTNFDEYAISLPMQGSKGMPHRSWQGMFEFPTGQFLTSFFLVQYDRRIFAEWLSEAVKRFVIPALAMAHALLGIGLVLNVGGATGRRSFAAGAVIGAIPAIHVAILIAAESLIRVQPALTLVVVALVAAECAFGAWLIQRQQRVGASARGRPAQESRPAPA